MNGVEEGRNHRQARWWLPQRKAGELLLDLQRRGLTMRLIAIGDGATGVRCREVFGATKKNNVAGSTKPAVL
jgi:hypothetical protein